MTSYLSYVDRGQFNELFEELGWGYVPSNVPPIPFESETGTTYTANPVADQSGLRVWVVKSEKLPSSTDQRLIDASIQKVSQLRLVIFTDGTHQSWRWPRRGATAATNKKLLHHHYTVGNEEQSIDLERRLQVIELPIGEKIDVLAIQERMAKAFNEEAIKRSQEASRHMNVMNQQLLTAGCTSEEASSLLVRLLFLFFGDDTDMWKKNQFYDWVLHHTTAENIHDKLTELFAVLCDPELDKTITTQGQKATGKYAGTEFEGFRQIGGMYKDVIELPELTEDFRQQVLKASDFDWGQVNPDIFGAMFQQLVDVEDLRKNGEHYTSEENIMKVINPMFLEDYQRRFEEIKDDRKQLLALQDELSRLQFLDPACGCGNFLIQAYKHLRGLEYEIISQAKALELKEIQKELEERRWSRNTAYKKKLKLRFEELMNQNAVNFGSEGFRESKISMKQFYGIELNQWPAKVAATAMLLVDHLCNQAWGNSVVRLPIEETPEIINANALTLDWSEVVPDDEKKLFVFGNPPFIGQYTKTKEQTEDMKRVWGKDYDGYLDYVTSWHAQAMKLLAERVGEFAYVTTNSITQGQPVPALFGPLQRENWRIKFAHRTFAWDSEAPGKAAVHCVIVGFTRNRGVKQRLWDYPQVNGSPVEITVETGINAYLVDGSNVLVQKRSKVLAPQLRKVTYGSKPTDGGHLIVAAEDYDAVKADPAAAKYLRPFRGARELLHGEERWCLWIEPSTMDPRDLQASPILRERLEAVRKFRLESKKSATRELAEVPYLFAERRAESKPYLCIPSVVSETRRYFTAARYDSGVISSNSVFQTSDEDGLQFALISSSMFITWQKMVGGRLESRLRFANTLTWNTFPVPKLDEDTQKRIVKAGQKVLDARALHPERSLAQHYAPLAMAPELVKAHDALDKEVDKAFGADERLTSERQRQQLLFDSYSVLTSDV